MVIMDHERKLPFYVGITFLFLVGALIYYRFFGIIFPIDDAYILTHNLKVLHEGGKDVNFVGSPVLSGVTSLPHFSLIALVSLFTNPLIAQYIVAWFAALLYAFGLIKLAFLNGLSNIQTMTFVLLGLVLGEVPHQLLNGLETGIALAAIAWILVLLIDKPKGRSLPLLCGCLPFIRPELAALSLLVLLNIGWIFWQEKKNKVDFLANFSRSLVFMLIGASSWLLWYFYSIGSPYPNTIMAKKIFFAENNFPWLLKIRLIIMACFIFAVSLGPIIAIILVWLKSSIGKISLAFTIIFLLAYFQFPGALWHNDYRYLYVLVPLFLSGIPFCLRNESKLLRVAGSCILVISLGYSLFFFPARLKLHLDRCNITTTELDGAARWCQINLPHQAKLLVHDIGYLSFSTDFKLVDAVGLKTPEAIKFHRRYTYPTGGRERSTAISDIASLLQPGYLVVLNGWDKLFHITTGLQQHGWQLKPLRENLANHNNFYLVYKLSRGSSPASP
jgi:hypothetical protein